MNNLMQTHTSAKPSHYNKEAEFYDKFNEKGSEIINQVIEEILRKYKVTSVLDLTCGTGSQVFYLNQKGYEIVGSDINAKMLKIAKDKANHSDLKITFLKGDMRTTQAGNFDAVLTIFNAVGHLTKTDFTKAIKNIHKNLNTGGIYLFDNFNLDFLQHQDNITKLTIDGQRIIGGVTKREIQYSTINNDGVLASYDIYLEQEGNNNPTISKAFQTLQVYSRDQIKHMLKNNGFEVLRVCNIDGSRFSVKESERFLVIAKKI
jgi:2-polyprenyl-3-methyl-5-hydroxy-6-metoxy-1,4-benzoquinol methylase